MLVVNVDNIKGCQTSELSVHSLAHLGVQSRYPSHSVTATYSQYPSVP